MCSKFIKLVVLLSLLVCCGFAGRVLYSRFSQLCRTRERSTSHMLNFFFSILRSEKELKGADEYQFQLGGPSLSLSAYWGLLWPRDQEPRATSN